MIGQTCLTNIHLRQENYSNQCSTIISGRYFNYCKRTLKRTGNVFFAILVFHTLLEQALAKREEGEEAQVEEEDEEKEGDEEENIEEEFDDDEELEDVSMHDTVCVS